MGLAGARLGVHITSNGRYGRLKRRVDVIIQAGNGGAVMVRKLSLKPGPG